MGKIVLGIVLFVVFLFVLGGLILMALWNALMPEIFGLPEIGFWQAVGISFLCSILFGTGRNFISVGKE